MNKGLTILGSAASGKTTLLKDIYPIIRETFQTWNQDMWVEDPKSDYYNNPLKAAKHLNEVVLPDVMSWGNNFVLDTTGSNLKTLRKIIDHPNYQFKAVVVYVNPIIAFIRNFSRERKLPRQVLLENWLKVYSQINDYREMFGEGNIYILETDYSSDEEFIINQLQMGRKSFSQILDGKDYNSSFKKDSTQYTPEQIIEKDRKFDELLDKVEKEWISVEENIKSTDNKQDIIKELKEWI